jgi:DNA-binding transcriptional MerR regulator
MKMKNAKKHFAISELAKEFDVSKRHIRVCEEKGLISPHITKLNRRIYSRYDRARLKMIFHYVLIGYSQDQIVELIGMPDAGLNEKDQIKKGLEYAEGMIEKLDKRRNEISFHQRTSIINEIKLLREYIKEIKDITFETSDESAAKPLIQDKARKPVEKIKPEVERRPGRRPVRMIPIYTAGLAIVLIIGGFFYFQASKKKTETTSTETTYLVQKDQSETETKPVYHDRVPIDNTGDPKGLTPIPPEPSASTLVSQQELAEESRESVGQKLPKDQAESAVLSNKLVPEATSKISPVPAKISPTPIKQEIVSPPEKQPLEVKEEKKTLPKTLIVEKPAAEKAAAEKAAAEKAAAEKAAAEKAAAEKAAAEKAAAEKAAAEKAAAEKAAAEKVAAEKVVTSFVAKPKVEKQKVAVGEVNSVEIKKDVHAIPVTTVAPILPKTPPAPGKQETVSLSNLQASEVEAKEVTVEESDIKEPLVTAEIDKSVIQEPKAERPGVVEESKPSKPEKDKEMLASKEKTISQQEQKDRLESFLRIYCRAYESKDLDKFASLFTSDATENNTPFQDMLPNYQKNMENIKSYNYRIELVDYSYQNDTGNIRINGKYFTRFLLDQGTWEETSGSISMELITRGDSYLVKRLNYGH